MPTPRAKFLLANVFAYENQPGWKMNADGTAVEVKDGHPVYIGTDGREMIVKGDTLSSLRNEAMTHRTEKEQLQAKFKDFDGLDPKKAREALEIASKLDQKQLIDAGKVDEVKNQITAQFTTQLTEKEKTVQGLQSKIEQLLVNNVFANSEFVRNNLAIPRDMFEAYFRSNFKVENEQVVAYDKAGNRLMSKKAIGEFAAPEEALEILVEAHPQKDIILRAEVGNGSGNNGAGGNSGRSATIRRAEFEKKSPAQQAEISAKIRSGEMRLTD